MSQVNLFCSIEIILLVTWCITVLEKYENVIVKFRLADFMCSKFISLYYHLPAKGCVYFATTEVWQKPNSERFGQWSSCIDRVPWTTERQRYPHDLNWWWRNKVRLYAFEQWLKKRVISVIAWFCVALNFNNIGTF